MQFEPISRIVRFDQCFGWLHTPADGRSNDVAVVLCPGLFEDGLTGYRPLRLLANALAKAGYPVLRFDYPGTGHSSDVEGEDLWLEWRNSIHAAIDWLLHHALADRIVLCGLRAGAALAMEASASRSDIAGLLLLEPVVRGRSYLRHLSLNAGWEQGNSSLSGRLPVQGLELSERAVRHMAQLDLRQIRPASGCPICVFTRSPARLLSECVTAWREAGITVQSETFGGLEAMLRPVLMSHMASIDPASILAWLQNSIPTRSTALDVGRLPDRSTIAEVAATEVSVRFGPREELFGVLREPRHGSTAKLAVIITNSSGDPCYGRARSGLVLARAFATAGIASLRMDFTGLGESVAVDDGPAHIFEADRRGELRSAVDLLASRGYRKFAAYGLCSGAYHALHGAFGDPRISALLLVNLQHLSWVEGDRIELKGYALHGPAHFLKSLAKGVVWVNLMRGRYNLRGICAMQLARCSDELRRLVLRMTERLGGHAAPKDTIIDRMQALSLRARTLLLMSEGDEGIPVMIREFGPALTLPGTLVEILPGLDHGLSTRSMLQTVIDRVIEFLQSTYPELSHLEPARELTSADSPA